MRDSILHVTSVMLADCGYGGTSVRAIGQAAGIRGPSIYHHFASKDAVIEELLALSLNASAALARKLAREHGDPATRLYRMIVFDFVHLHAAHHDFRGVYNPALLARPAFREWREQLDRMHSDIATIINEGSDSGRFLDVDPSLVQEAMSGLVLRVFANDAVRDSDALALAEAAARFVLRAIVVEPAQLHTICEQAQARFAQDRSDADLEASAAGRMPL